MLFKIKEIGDGGLSLNLPVTAPWLAVQCPDLEVVPAAGGLKVRGQLLLSGDDVFLRGSLRGVLDSTCSRCLEKAKISLDVPLMVTFRARPASADRPANTGRPNDAADVDEDDEEDVDVALYDGETIDLGPEIRDQILLALPLKPLCREDCQGLCAVCGGNRNQVACDCEARQSPNRTPLASVLGKLKI